MRLSQSEQDLTLTGQRPPSACSSSRPNSGRRSGRAYVKVANTSVADELLFSSSINQMKLEEPSFDAPWATKKGKQQILFWAPAPSSERSARSRAAQTETHGRPSSASTTKTTPKIKDTMLKNRHHYKIVKHAPSFVDECLFGPRLEEPSFTAPWNVKPKKPLVSPLRAGPSQNNSDVDTTSNKVTKLNFRYRSPAAKRSKDCSAKPVWKL